MTSLAKFIANPNIKLDTYTERRTRNVTLRRYDIFAYKGQNEPVIFAGLTSKAADEKKTELYRDGFYRVDKIESRTKVYERTLTFDGTYELPEKLPLIETPDEKPKNIQTTFPWEVISNDVPAFLYEQAKKIEEDRTKEHNRAQLLRMRNNRSIETRIEKVTLFDSRSNIVFHGTYEEALFFLMNTKMDITELIYKES